MDHKKPQSTWLIHKTCNLGHKNVITLQKTNVKINLKFNSQSSKFQKIKFRKELIRKITKTMT